MIYSKSFLFSILALLACLISKSANAHNLNAAETNISYNERTKNIEIVHRFYLHDVNHLVQKHFKNAKQQSTEEQKYQVFTDYILKNTELEILNIKEKPINISYIGSELEAKHYYIYQEVNAATLSDIACLKVDIQAMQNQWKPKYWLYNIRLKPQKSQSFVIDQDTTRYQFNM